MFLTAFDTGTAHPQRLRRGCEPREGLDQVTYWTAALIAVRPGTYMKLVSLLVLMVRRMPMVRYEHGHGDRGQVREMRKRTWPLFPHPSTTGGLPRAGTRGNRGRLPAQESDGTRR